MNVRKIQILDRRKRPLAVLGSEGWIDPYGGAFTVAELADLDRVLEGETNEVTFAHGTKDEMTYPVRVQVVLDDEITAKLVKELEDAVTLVARTLREISPVDYTKSGVVLDREDWHQLEAALGAWSRATERFLVDQGQSEKPAEVSAPVETEPTLDAFIQERARGLALCLMNYTEIVKLDERAELCEAAIREILRVARDHRGSGVGP